MRWPFSKKKKEDKLLKSILPNEVEIEKAIKEQDDTRFQVVDLCEQIVQLSNEMEELKSEYTMVSNYLSDIEVVEGLPKEKKSALVEFASHIVKVNKDRNELSNIKNKLSEVTFAQMQEEEAQIPKIVKRLKENESNLENIIHDMKVLEREKEHWLKNKDKSQSEQEFLRKMGLILLFTFGIVLATFLVIGLLFEISTQLIVILAVFLCAIAACAIIVRYQECAHNIKKSYVNMDHIISLENHIKIKYVNMKNAVDYMHEKYHVNSAKELTDQYEKYQEMVRQREKYKIANADFEYYQKQMLSLLQQLQLYDTRIWLNYVDAIIDKREMVEIKHDLIVRRQKLRERMESDLENMISLSKELDKVEKRLDEIPAQVSRLLNQTRNLVESHC